MRRSCRQPTRTEGELLLRTEKQMLRIFDGVAKLVLMVALSSTAASADGTLQEPAKQHAGVVNSPISIRSEMARRPPDVVLGSTRIWHLSATSMQRTAIIEMRDGLPRHLHPDGAHYLYVVEGMMTADVDSQSFSLGPGDYIVIAANAPHNYRVPSGERVVLLSMDSPAYDPTKTFWLDKAPNR